MKRDDVAHKIGKVLGCLLCLSVSFSQAMKTGGPSAGDKADLLRKFEQISLDIEKLTLGFSGKLCEVEGEKKSPRQKTREELHDLLQQTIGEHTWLLCQKNEKGAPSEGEFVVVPKDEEFEVVFENEAELISSEFEREVVVLFECEMKALIAAMNWDDCSGGVATSEVASSEKALATFEESLKKLLQSKKVSEELALKVFAEKVRSQVPEGTPFYQIFLLAGFSTAKAYLSTFLVYKAISFFVVNATATGKVLKLIYEITRILLE